MLLFVPVPSRIVTRYFSLIALWLSASDSDTDSATDPHYGYKAFTLNAPLQGYSSVTLPAHTLFVRTVPNVLMDGRFLLTQRLELVAAADVGCQFAKDIGIQYRLRQQYLSINRYWPT